MDFRFDAATEKLRDSLLAFMDEKIYPAEPVFAGQMASLSNRWAWTQTPIMGELRAEAHARGLWNLFLPGEHGAGLTNLQYAPLAEITGRSLALAPAALNCAAAQFGGIRTLRFADGPDEDHKDSLARAELKRHAHALGRGDLHSGPFGKKLGGQPGAVRSGGARSPGSTP